MAKTIIQPISMSQEDKDHCKEKSKKLLGRENVSGYIAVLIQKDKENETRH
jgi:ribosomal protein S17E